MSARLLTRLSRRARRRGGERGLTLIEVLVAFLLLFIVTLAVLQLLSMAYLDNLGAMIRTELTYKAEQVVETIRLLNFRYYSLLQPPSPTEIICCPVSAGSSGTITPAPGPCTDFWGPNGANVINASSRFSLNYSIDPNLVVMVRAAPYKDPSSGQYLYLGPAANKVVIYAAQMRNW